MNYFHEQGLVQHFQHSQQLYFLVTDLTGRLLYANSLFEKRSGYDLTSLSTLSMTDIVSKQDIHKCHLAIEQSVRNNSFDFITEPLCLEQSGSSEKISWELSLIRNSNDNRPEAIRWIGVEERKGESYHESDFFYKNLIADSLDGILVTDDKGVISFASPSTQKILGYEPGELVNKNAFDFVHNEDRTLTISAFYEEIENAPKTKFINARILQRSGEWLWCMVRGHNQLSNPNVRAMLIYFCDDTSRRNAEAALVESEQRFRQLIHNLRLGVLLLNEKGEVLICNEPAFELLGVTEDKIMGKAIADYNWQVIHEDGTKFLPEQYPITIAIQTGKPVKDAVMGIMRPGNGERIWLFVSTEPVFDERNNLLYVICSYTDITDQRKLSRQLLEQEMQKQKLLMQATIDGQENERSEIGRELHDNISQHLTTTRLYLEVAKDKADGELLQMINLAHKGLMDIVNEIRRLSQSLVPPSLSDIGLVASVQDLCDPLKNTHAFEIYFLYDDFDESALQDNMKLMLYRIIQEQINNIIRHARANTIHISLKTIKDRVVLSVADNGKGFDPKSVKKGLGFYNMSNRVGLFGGTVRIDSAPGKGCSVRVNIPL